MIKYSYDVYYNNEFLETRIDEYPSAEAMETFRDKGKHFSTISYRNWTRLADTAKTFRERLTANANDFDSIIVDMLARIEELENEI